METVRFDNGTQMVQALQGGSLDGAVAGAGVISGVPMAGAGRLVFPSYIETNTNAIYAGPDSGIASAGDLAGKSLALPIGTTAHVLAAFAADASGTPYSDLKIVNTKYNDAPTVLARGAVDSAVVVSTFRERIENEVEGATLVTSLSDYYPERAIVGGLLFTNEALESKREGAERATAGMMQAYVELIAPDSPAHETVWAGEYEDIESFDAYKTARADAEYPTLEEWRDYLGDGTVHQWSLDVARVLDVLQGKSERDDVPDAIDVELFDAAVAAATSED